MPLQKPNKAKSEPRSANRHGVVKVNSKEQELRDQDRLESLWGSEATTRLRNSLPPGEKNKSKQDSPHSKSAHDMDRINGYRDAKFSPKSDPRRTTERNESGYVSPYARRQAALRAGSPKK